ncbi:MAG: T9SS type A sorting domain-containing protein [Flavobacteriales bacterium]
MKTLTKLRLPFLASAAAVVMAGVMNSADAQIYASSAELTLGTFANGNPIPASYFRSQKFNAIGEPQRSDVSTQVNGNPNSVNFTSLGFGGSIVLTMDAPFGQCEGPDGFAHETSYNTPSCGSWREFAKLEVSQDGCNWYTVVESACQDFAFDLPDEMPWALYIRITDVSNPNHFGGGADGWDLDGVEAFCASNVTLLPPGAAFGASGHQDYLVGNTKNGGSVPAARRIASRAHGTPQMSDVSTNSANFNFVSLGFEGSIVLKFDYTVFDRPGADITVYETTFGDNLARPCSNYPEIAKFEGSVDGVNWYLLSAATVEPASLASGRLCRDGQLDISNMPNGVLRYLRITDESERSSSRFPGNADGYDVDGVLVGQCEFIQNEDGSGAFNSIPNPTLTMNGKLAAEDGNILFEEPYVNFGVYPNPANNFVTINIETSGKDENYVIRIDDVVGRTVVFENINAGANANVLREVNLAGVPSGIYMVTVETKEAKMTQKIVKN